jgi:hypothetical protein
MVARNKKFEFMTSKEHSEYSKNLLLKMINQQIEKVTVENGLMQRHFYSFNLFGNLTKYPQSDRK